MGPSASGDPAHPVVILNILIRNSGWNRDEEYTEMGWIHRLWKLSGHVEARRFQRALQYPERAQRRVLTTILSVHRRARGISDYESFRRLPLTEYADYEPHIRRMMATGENPLTREPVRLLEPTSGSSGGTKLIPYTPLLQKQFQAAVQPWLVDTFRRYPEVLGGRHYWSISPNTRPNTRWTGDSGNHIGDGAPSFRAIRPNSPMDRPSRIPVGFDDDASYLAGPEAWAARRIWAVPEWLSRVADMRSFEYLTILFLLRRSDLRLISVWHPSFLVLMLDHLERHWESAARDIYDGSISAEIHLPSVLGKPLGKAFRADPRRARELRKWGPNPDRIWPNLRVISCWAGIHQEPWLARIRAAFPRAAIEPKGLIATEGIAGIPWKGEMVLSVNSHFFEFLDESGIVLPAWDLREGREYRLLLTVGNGFLRYQTWDIVRVAGFRDRTPRIEFLARDATSDMVGEKLHEAHVAEILHRLLPEVPFKMLAPWADGECRGYMLCCRLPEGMEPEGVLEALERELCGNFHYAHARRLGQLGELRFMKMDDGAAERFRREVAAQNGCGVGDVKFPRLANDAAINPTFYVQSMAGLDLTCEKLRPPTASF